jgi:hypothetical protein
VGDKQQNGIFYGNSRTRHAEIFDGSSNTVLLGERSSSGFDSSWAGVIDGDEFTGWRVVAWTGEPPNNRGQAGIEARRYAQFNSSHSSYLTIFAMADTSVSTIAAEIDPTVFRALGTIAGRETIDASDFR